MRLELMPEQPIRGSDWRRPELQERYAGHFLPCIEQRIRSASKA